MNFDGRPLFIIQKSRTKLKKKLFIWPRAGIFFLLLSSSRKANDKSNLSNFLLWLLFLEGKSSHSAPTTTATKCFVKRIPLSKMALRETIPNPASIHTYLAGWQFWRVAKICNMCIQQTDSMQVESDPKEIYICIIKPNESERTWKIFWTIVADFFFQTRLVYYGSSDLNCRKNQRWY